MVSNAGVGEDELGERMPRMDPPQAGGSQQIEKFPLPSGGKVAERAEMSEVYVN